MSLTPEKFNEIKDAGVLILHLPVDNSVVLKDELWRWFIPLRHDNINQVTGKHRLGCCVFCVEQATKTNPPPALDTLKMQCRKLQMLNHLQKCNFARRSGWNKNLLQAENDAVADIDISEDESQNGGEEEAETNVPAMWARILNQSQLEDDEGLYGLPPQFAEVWLAQAKKPPYPEENDPDYPQEKLELCQNINDFKTFSTRAWKGTLDSIFSNIDLEVEYN